MSLLKILIGAGIVVGASVAVLVYLDCRRRDLPPSSRLVWALICGGGSFAAFLVPYVFQYELQFLYFGVLKPRPVAVSPYESLLVTLTAGLGITLVLVSLYLAESRFWNWTATETQ